MASCGTYSAGPVTPGLCTVALLLLSLAETTSSSTFLSCLPDIGGTHSHAVPVVSTADCHPGCKPGVSALLSSLVPQQSNRPISSFLCTPLQMDIDPLLFVSLSCKINTLEKGHILVITEPSDSPVDASPSKNPKMCVR